jgi:hypothetical protein
LIKENGHHIVRVNYLILDLYLPVVKKCFWENNKQVAVGQKRRKVQLGLSVSKKFISTMKSCSSAFHHHNKIPFGKKSDSIQKCKQAMTA